MGAHGGDDVGLGHAAGAGGADEEGEGAAGDGAVLVAVVGLGAVCVYALDVHTVQPRVYDVEAGGPGPGGVAHPQLRGKGGDPVEEDADELEGLAVVGQDLAVGDDVQSGLLAGCEVSEADDVVCKGNGVCVSVGLVLLKRIWRVLDRVVLVVKRLEGLVVAL